MISSAFLFCIKANAGRRSLGADAHHDQGFRPSLDIRQRRCAMGGQGELSKLPRQAPAPSRIKSPLAMFSNLRITKQNTKQAPASQGAV
jgi:hypothetical protein